MRFSVILLNYFSRKDVFNTVDSLKRYNDFLHYYIVDNSDDKEEYDFLCEHFISFKNVTLIRSDTNVGYAKGNNLALEQAKVDGFDYFLLLNPDVEITSEVDFNYIKKSLDTNPKLALLGPKVFNPAINSYQGPLKSSHPIKDYLRLPKFLRKVQCAQPSNEIITEVYSIVGCCIFGSLHRFSEVGFFDPNTFLYFEEQIAAERLTKKGFWLGYYSELEVTHNHPIKFSTWSHEIKRLKSIKNSSYYFFTKYKGANWITMKINSIVFWGNVLIKLCFKRLFKG
jgi:GT2 family glycosyltransferase